MPEGVNPSLVFFFFDHLQSVSFLPQIRSLRRERAETTVEKEELVDHPMENGTLHSPTDGFCWGRPALINSCRSKLSGTANHCYLAGFILALKSSVTELPAAEMGYDCPLVVA